MSDPEQTRVAPGVSAENEALTREQFHSMTRLVPFLYATIIANTILLAWILRDWVPVWANGALTAIVVASIGVRIVHWVRLRGTAYTLDLPRIRGAIRGVAIVGPVLSFAYAVIAFLWVRQVGTGTAPTLYVMSIWILASACSFCLFSLLNTAVRVLVLACVPLALAFLLSGDLQVMLELPAFITISALMIYVLRENYKIFKEIVNSRTKLRILQEQLGQQHQHLARAQRVGLVGSADVDLRTGTVIWSDQLFALLGLDSAAVVPGLDAFVAVVHPDDRDLVRDAATQNRRGVNVAPMEFRVLRADGSVRWLAWASDLILSDKGIAEKVIATVHEITERKRAEGQNRELLLQLSQAQKMEAVGHLTGGIAHDFNNLLAVILGRLQLLDEELPEDNPELHDWVRSSIQAVDRGATLTKSLVAFSRRQTLAPIELNLNAVIDEIEAMLRQTLGDAYELRVSKAPALWRVAVDPGQLQSALLNLVLNARDAMLKDGIITIATANATLDAEYAGVHSEVRPGDYVMLIVSDTGIGMSHDVAQRAFEPFFTTKDVGKGSGLGLSMVYGFVKQSGGHVTIDSEPGEGTTVRVYLPRKVDGQAPAKAPSVPTADRGIVTILVVEDNDDLRRLTRLQLERLGYVVHDAGHGAEALRILRENLGIDLLLSDVLLPQGMSGPELAEVAMALLPKIRVIFMSGHSEQRGMLERARKRGPIRLLQKPFHLDELATQIKAALE